MRTFTAYKLEKTKKLIKANYNNYDCLLELSAKLLLTIDDAEKVITELSISNVSPDIISISKDGIEKKISQSHMALDVLASTGNEFAIDALKDIYPNLEKGRKFKPSRVKGSKSEKNKYIHKLALDNPNLSAKELEKILDKTIVLEPVNSRTFANQVTKARKPKR